MNRRNFFSKLAAAIAAPFFLWRNGDSEFRGSINLPNQKIGTVDASYTPTASSFVQSERWIIMEPNGEWHILTEKEISELEIYRT